jgi:two-component system response regulator PilR (NtrC family)
MQSKLLRAIQERSVRPLGSTQEETVDVRIVSATHRDLAADVQTGRFRQDLYYRLNVIEIVIPPLRERREDLPALCAALLARIAHESGMPAPALSDQALAAIAAHPLTGNVRELENLLHRAVALSEGEELHVDWPCATAEPVKLRATPDSIAQPMPAESPSTYALSSSTGVDGPVPLPNDLQAWLDHQERDILIRALRETGFNRTATAARLGISLRQIRYRIARLNIAVPGDQDAHDDTR